MAFVYLIGEDETINRFKIGVTKCNDINKRLKKLQTGNSNELFIKHVYETDRPFKLETMLHNYYKHNNILNEWYELSPDDVKSFCSVCNKMQTIIDSLSDNPYF